MPFTPETAAAAAAVSVARRGRKATPTRAEVVAAWARIRDAAEAGDIAANAALLALVDGRAVQVVMMDPDGGPK